MTPAHCTLAENILGTPECREKKIQFYMSRRGGKLTRAEAEAKFKWAYGLNAEPVREVHERQYMGIFHGWEDFVEESESKWFVSGEDFIAKELEPRGVYLSDKETGAVVLYQASINQIFATRGLGKSIVTNALLRCLVGGEDFLRLQSKGGHSVLLVDAELPPIQLQERLKEFGQGEGLTILSPYLMANPKEFPNLSEPGDQDRFLDRLEEEDVQIVIFDTLTRCFRFDTNDPDAWLRVNDFLTDLRGMGYCVLLIHHAGKNNTQRGRTDGDDNLDVSIQLDKRYGWQPGDGLQFKWTYSKVRHGGHLPDFEAVYATGLKGGQWELVEDERRAKVLALHKEGKSSRAIATQLELSQSTVSRMLRGTWAPRAEKD